MSTINKTTSGTFDVAKNYSQTIDNEKKLINQLSNKLSEEINRELLIKINDL